MKHEGWDRLAGGLGIDLQNDQIDRLESFEALIHDHALPLGMVATSDAGRLRERHIHDSMRAATIVRSSDRSAYDLGSGAGLPGIVVAIARPTLHVTLVESRRPRAAFLTLAVDRLGLGNVAVVNARVETLSDRVDLCLSRAFAPAAVAWRVADQLLLPGGRLVYFAGERFSGAHLPEGVDSQVVTTSALARSGPLVIMSRQ